MKKHYFLCIYVLCIFSCEYKKYNCFCEEERNVKMVKNEWSKAKKIMDSINSKVYPFDLVIEYEKKRTILTGSNPNIFAYITPMPLRFNRGYEIDTTNFNVFSIDVFFPLNTEFLRELYDFPNLHTITITGNQKNMPDWDKFKKKCLKNIHILEFEKNKTLNLESNCALKKLEILEISNTDSIKIGKNVDFEVLELKNINHIDFTKNNFYNAKCIILENVMLDKIDFSLFPKLEVLIVYNNQKRYSNKENETIKKNFIFFENVLKKHKNIKKAKFDNEIKGNKNFKSNYDSWLF